MPDPVKIGALIHLPPTETVRAFEARGDLQPTVRWDDMWEEDHARAFTVAKVAKLDLLETIRASLADAAGNGMTFEQWKAQLVPQLQAAGWWGRVVNPDITGTDQPVMIGPRRLATIFNTNMRVSRAAGQWARIQDRKDVAPYLRYTAVMDARTRPLHRLWHGTILPVDDPWWQTHFPPCGWNCRCWTVQLGERELHRFGWKPNKDAPAEGPMKDYVRGGTGEVVKVPAGIDPGWGYNPGAASMRGIADKAIATLQQTAGADLAGARAVLDELVGSPAFPAAMGQPDTTFPVMVLDQAISALVNSEARVAALPAETYAARPEVTIEQWRQLPSLGASPDIVATKDDMIFLLSREPDESWRVTQLKRAPDGSALVVADYSLETGGDIQQLLQGATIVKGEGR